MPPLTDTPFRIRSGLEACAHALAHDVSHVALAGGDGARRLAHALSLVGIVPRGAPDDEAAREVAGAALAGRAVAIVASGRTVTSALVPTLRMLAQRPVVVVLASTCDDGSPPFDDLTPFLAERVGIFVATTPREVARLTRAAMVEAREASMPWCVAFDLLHTGDALEAVYDEDFVAPSPGASLAVDVPGDIPTCVGVGIADDVGVAPRVGLRRVRPFPARELALALACKPSVTVEDPWPDAFEHGWLTTRVALVLHASRICSRTTTPFYSNERGTIRIDFVWNEPARTRLVSEFLHMLASQGVQLRAHRQSPWFTSMKIPEREGTPRRVVLCEAGALGLWAVLADVGTQTAVVLLGAASEHDRVALEAHCSQRGASLLHVPDAWLACLNS